MSIFPPHLLAVAVGGALGASLRYLFLSLAVGGAAGIFLLNVFGSLALGALFAWEARPEWVTVLAGAGILGALTTFSTFSSDIARLAQESPVQSFLYVLLSVSLGFLAFLLGGFLVRSFS